MTNENSRLPLSVREKVALAVAGIGILAASLAAAGYMFTHRPRSIRRPTVPGAPAVRVQELQPTSYDIVVPVMGTVVPAVEVDLKARVGGEVTWVNPEFVEGGVVRKGDVLVKIDPVDYQLALTRKKAVLETAVYDLKAEQGKQEIARKEWEILDLKDKASESDRELALRQPQLKAMEAKLNAARAEVKEARLNLDRTVIRAPFNALVLRANVDVGGQATVQGTLGHLAGSDIFHVRALIPMDRLKWVVFPNGHGAKGSSASIRTGTGKILQGRLFKLMGDLEPNGRLARILIEVRDPMNLKSDTGDRSFLLLGDFVSVKIKGRSVEDVFVIPRADLRDGNVIWMVDGEDRLRMGNVDPIWMDESNVLVREPAPGTRLVVSDLPAPVEGMKVRIQGPDGAEIPGNAGGKETGRD